METRGASLRRLRAPEGAGGEAREFPKPPDNFRWRYYGLFYVAPAQNSYMCRLRIPNGILDHWQLDGLADIAETLGGGYATSPRAPTCRSARSRPTNAVKVVEAIQDLGLASRGSGADNIRNVTGTPTAGIDPQELLDTRPYAREWHFHILNDRSLTGLPRKFNVAFDGAGRDRGARGDERHRLPGRRGRGRRGRPGRHLLPPRARRHHRPQGLRPRHRRRFEAGARRRASPTPSCASSSTAATAPTATRRGSNTCSTLGASKSFSPQSKSSSAQSLRASSLRT